MRHKSQQPTAPPAPDPHYEALLRMRTNNPTAFRVRPRNTRPAVLYYKAAKREDTRLKAMRAEVDYAHG